MENVYVVFVGDTNTRKGYFQKKKGRNEDTAPRNYHLWGYFSRLTEMSDHHC